MCINEISKSICHEDSADKNTRVTVYLHHDTERVNPLWQGKASELKDQAYLSDYLVVEMLVDRSPEFDHLPDYNKGKIITVV